MTLSARRRWAAIPLLALVFGLVWTLALRLGPHPRGLSATAGRSGAVLNLAEPRRLPVEAWTDHFREREESGEWAGLVVDLEAIRDGDPDLYQRYRLAYLHARAKLAAGDAAGGRTALEPFLAPDDSLRDLALYWSAQAAAGQGKSEEAARFREDLIFNHPKSPWRGRSIEDQLETLAAAGDPARLADFGARLGSTVDPSVQRDVESRVIVARAARADAGAVEQGLRFLRANAADDAAERVAAALERPEWLEAMAPEDWALLGETLRNARHFERALALLQRALPRLPARRDDLLFAIGRAYFADEKYEDAERVFLEGAPRAHDGETRANFLYQASRCAQIRGDDARAERQLTQAISAGGTTTRGASALTQRIRLRVRQRRFPEAFADLKAVQKRFAATHAPVEATLAFAIGALAAGRGDAAVTELERIKPRLLTKADVPEIQYWRARAVEGRDPRLATRIYLKVLRADTPTHFAYLARRRLAEEPMASRVRSEVETREADVVRLLAEGRIDEARDLQTEVALLSPPEREAAALERLRGLYQQSPAYREIVELPPPEYPHFPLFAADTAEQGRLDLLLAMGLFDDATDLITSRYALHPLAAALARSEALRRAGASRASIYAIEVGREDVPAFYLPQLLPRLVRELIYPRYFAAEIDAQSKRFGADPRLVLSIMREESRFNARAKSAAAARGLLQFIITTARQVGEAIGLVQVKPEDLYDPRVVIQLGAKYIGDLLRQFGADPYQAAAAYNAGPNQARLWARLAPAAGSDMYLSAINFDETKDYVRKVLNSYERYGEVYESAPPTGGVRAEP